MTSSLPSLREALAKTLAEHQSARMASRYPARMSYSACPWEKFSDDTRAEVYAEIDALSGPLADLVEGDLGSENEMRGAILAAWQAGALAVHRYVVEQYDVPENDPDFTESAHDYVASLMLGDKGSS